MVQVISCYHVHPITACPAQCDQGQGRCYLGPIGGVCCNFYLQGNCQTDCPSALVADSNFNCGEYENITSSTLRA